MTLIFIKDVIDRYDEKVAFTNEIATKLTPTLLTNPSHPIVLRYHNKSIAIGGCDALGRCDKNLLLESCKKHDVVITPCIGGRYEYEAKRELSNFDCTIIEIVPPRIKHRGTECKHSISNMVASSVAEYVKQIIK